MTKPRAVEPWIVAYRHSLKRPHARTVWLLVSRQDAFALAQGRVPTRVRTEADTLLAWTPRPLDAAAPRRAKR